MMSFLPTSSVAFAAPIDTAIWTNSSPIAGGDPLQPPREMNFFSATAPLHQITAIENASVGFVEPSGDTSALSSSPLSYYSSYPVVPQPSYPYTDVITTQSAFLPPSGPSIYTSTSSTTFDSDFWDAPVIVQPKEEILREIMAECEEIERRSPHSSVSHSSASSIAAASPLSVPSSVLSDDSSDSARSSPGPVAASTTRPTRKERKKMQNRVAATRYREKKRKEKEETRGVMEELEKKNAELKEKANAIAQEVSYLKKLFNEIGVEESRLTPSQ
ncbi:atf-5 [Pristionchus pacificus]|uniref:Atf-5 n=1 Tax=Pristionchus pacificus TaxID=54126 RepID=A0A2A6BDJ7_PRIPA|nr:atf-5 [Pristionchus pacificus]|eukprot:PDM63953.1 atf-5 [Pristionchus pacificus]